jgi:hypothetical protein
MLQNPLSKSQRSFWSLRTTVLSNFVFVLGICIYGFLTDEDYWRMVGHSPNLYNYLLWAGLALNGPSGFVADHLATLISSKNYDPDWLIEYGLWLLLLWPQWRGYDHAAKWCLGDRRRATVLYVVIGAITAIGCAATFRDQARYLYPDSVFLVDRVAAIAVAGFVVLAYIQFQKRDGALKPQ